MVAPDKIKKIAIDCHTLEFKNWAGKEHCLNNILQELIKLDQKNKYVLYFRKPVFKKNLPINWQIKNINLPMPFWQISVIFDLLFQRIDILLVPSTYLLPALNFLTPLLIIIHDLTTFLPETKKTHKKIVILKEKITLKLAIRHAKKIIAISENTKQDLIKFFKTPVDKIIVVPLAARDIFCPIFNQEKIKIIRKKYNLPAEFILFVGTLEPRKNIVRLIEAYHKLIFNFSAKGGSAPGGQFSIFNLKLVIVGKKGWYWQEIFEKVKKLNMEDKVVFTGYLPDQDLPYLYNAALCFVYPSLYEGFGLPIIEAMACGCPVITSNISSLPEVAGEAAILVDPYNSQEIADALKKIIRDLGLREKLKRAGLVQAQKFSWQKTAQEILQVICGD